MYIVKKTISGHDYYYLNKSVREGSKVKSVNIAYLGKDKEEAEKKAKGIIDGLGRGEGEKEKPVKIKIGKKVDEITSISSKRGFFFQTANIYGGKAGFFTYGHLGKALKANWEDLWRKNFLGLDENFFEIQSNNILPEEVFKASGHLESFNDPMTECKKCHFRFRADQFLEDSGMQDTEVLSIKELDNEIKERKLKCPKCGGKLSNVKEFNMMFSVDIGFDEEKGYLSPETAQGAYLAFKEEFQATRNKLPLGLAIIDKAYRNEISPRQMFFRLREFSQAELQIFFDSDKINEHEKWDEVKKRKLIIKRVGKEEAEEISCEDANAKLKLPKFYVYYASKIQDFYLEILKIPEEKFRFRELSKEERAFYNKIHLDMELDLDTIGGFKEVGGLHYRTDHDLLGHAKVSRKNLEVFYDGKKILPHVLELSFGVDRNVWALLDVFYHVSEEGSMFRFPPKLSPVKAAVFPVVRNNEKLVKIARDIYNDLNAEWNIIYDAGGSIGRRYSRADEVGVPVAITVDEISLKDGTITLRDRDTTKQIRVKIKDLKEVLRKLINGEVRFIKAGKEVSTRVK